MLDYKLFYKEANEDMDQYILDQDRMCEEAHQLRLNDQLIDDDEKFQHELDMFIDTMGFTTS